MPETEISELFSERRPAVVVDSIGGRSSSFLLPRELRFTLVVGKLAHRSHQQPVVVSPLQLVRTLTTGALSKTSPILVPKDQLIPDDPWRMLLGVDRASNKFPHLAMEILADERQKRIDVSQFTDGEAAQLIELIEAGVRDPRYLFDEGFNVALQILRHEDIPSRQKSAAFGILRRLCGTFQQLPESCLVRDELKIDDGLPLATHTYADLRKGNWRGKNVVVKLLRFAAEDDRAKITKVSSAFEYLIASSCR